MRILIGLALAVSAMAGEYALLDNGFRMYIERHEAAGAVVRLYTGSGEIELPATSVLGFEAEQPAKVDVVVEAPAPVSPDPKKLIDLAAERYGLPPEFLHSVASVESDYQTGAVSHKGAIGVMQLMPGTAALLKADPLNPEENIDAGARHLRDLLLRYDGGVYRALAAYNAGAGAVDRYQGIPPYRETRLYVEKVLERFERSKSER